MRVSFSLWINLSFLTQFLSITLKKKFVAVQEVQHEHHLCNQDPDLFPIHCIEPDEDDDYGKKNATH